MKKKLQMTGIIVSALTITSFATSPYIGLSGGFSLLSDSDISETGLDAKVSYDAGYNIEGAFGYDFDGWRAEAALGWIQNDLDEVSISGLGSGSVDGEMSVLTVMVNGYYDIKTDSPFTPYILAGLGIVNAEGEIEGSSEDDTVIGGQIGAGVGYALSEQVILDLKYKYLITEDLDLDGTDVSLGGSQFQFGVRYQF